MSIPLPPLAGWPTQTSFVREPAESFHRIGARRRKARRLSGRHYRRGIKR
ncbi:MAG: hypothetical protein JSR39_06645 [Verrucomicrobia bacterium]|nr:hypothetical protein [Verrucomicrobiota bacterium]